MFVKLKDILFFLFLFLLPTQLGKHFFLPFSYVAGVKVDYLSLILYTTDILACILILLNFKSIYKKVRKYFILWVIFILLLTLNAIFSFNGIQSLYHSIKYLELILIFIIFSHYKNSKVLLYAFLLGAFFELLLTTFQFMTRSSLQGIFYLFGERYVTLSHAGIAKIGIGGEEFLRPYGTFSHPNSLGGFYLLVFIFSLFYKPFTKFVLCKRILTVLSALLVFLSFSQTAIILLISITFTYVFFILKNVSKIFRIFILLSILSIGFFTSTLKHDPENIKIRIDLLYHSWMIFKQHLLFGVGLGNYLYFESAYKEKSLYFFLQPVHNIFAFFVTEAGIILSSFTIFILKTYFFKKNMMFYFLILAVIVVGMLDHYLLTLQQNFLLLGVIFGLAQLPEESVRLSDPKDYP